MPVAAVLARGRARARALMTDTCTIQRQTGSTTNPITGVVTPTFSAIYTGACRMQQATAPWAGPATVGQAGIGLFASEIQLPVVGSEGIAKDDIVTVTVCVNDPDLVGKKFTVQSAHYGTHKTARRLPLMQVLG
jgi:hypothetical protein